MVAVSDTIAALLDRMPVLERGHVWLAGAGPGDPQHLTLLALAALGQADVVVHDALVDGGVLDLARPDALRIFAGKRGGKPSIEQADITAQLVDLARAGHRVLRLKGGDPYMFGRGGEEVLTLAAQGVPFRVIPGVTAGLASLAAATIPATMRGINQAIVFATGHGAELDHGLDWAAMARLRQPIVLYMAVARLPVIVRALLAGGLAADTPAAAIENATMPAERVLVATLATLADAIAEAGLGAPAIIVIGGIVALRARLTALIKESVEFTREV